MRGRVTDPGVGAMVIGVGDPDHGPMDASANLPSQPTDEDVAHYLAELRQVMNLDLATLAARANLDPQLVAEIESGTRPWTLDELSAIAFGLGVTMTAIFRHWDGPKV
jgi:ribosome-binding protein aMBF1 (putative translation factor)